MDNQWNVDCLENLIQGFTNVQAALIRAYQEGDQTRVLQGRRRVRSPKASQPDSYSEIEFLKRILKAKPGFVTIAIHGDI